LRLFGFIKYTFLINITKKGVLSFRARTWQRELHGATRLHVGNLKRNKKAPPRRRAFRFSADASGHLKRQKSEKIARETEKKRFVNS